MQFINNDEKDITAFAILGDDNQRIEQKIDEIKQALGSEDGDKGLHADLNKKESELKKADEDLQTAESNLEKRLKEKATNRDTGIKYNRLYGDPNYNITKLKSDIEKVISANYSPITDEKAENNENLLRESPKADIPEIPELKLNISSLKHDTKQLVEKEISVSKPIQELLDSPELQEWVRDGLKHHREKRKTCGFCGSDLPHNLWEKLDNHFNEESEDLRYKINELLKQIEIAKKRVGSLITFTPEAFYSQYSGKIGELENEFKTESEQYSASLNHLTALLNQRLNNIFKHIEYTDIKDRSEKIKNIHKEYAEIRLKSNEFTKSQRKKQKEAKEILRLREVHKFVLDIQYKAETERHDSLKQSKSRYQANRDEVKAKIQKRKMEIQILQAQLKDESKGAERVNNYLNNFFGHEFLSLKAVKHDEDADYYFEITRNGKKAHHLSEGECNLVSFCYFMAKLEDVDTRGNSPIIWIDDPISSLDANHIFFVYSLIQSELTAIKKFKQLFVSTHSLDFLKYLHYLSGDGLKKKFFIVERAGTESQIKLMPDYLEKYVTEFNYLFHQIHKCANAETENDENHYCYYNFGNNARKFLETYVYYKYPNTEKSADKIKRLFADDTIPAFLTSRISNELSHLDGTLERSITPLDIPEIKKAAQFILKKVEETDKDQYDALLESIRTSN